MVSRQTRPSLAPLSCVEWLICLESLVGLPVTYFSCCWLAICLCHWVHSPWEPQVQNLPGCGPVAFHIHFNFNYDTMNNKFTQSLSSPRTYVAKTFQTLALTAEAWTLGKLCLALATSCCILHTHKAAYLSMCVDAWAVCRSDWFERFNGFSSAVLLLGSLAASLHSPPKYSASAPPQSFASFLIPAEPSTSCFRNEGPWLQISTSWTHNIFLPASSFDQDSVHAF